MRWRFFPFAFLLCFTGFASGEEYISQSVLVTGSSAATISSSLVPAAMHVPLMQLLVNGGGLIVAEGIAFKPYQAESSVRQSHADGDYNSSSFSLPALSAALQSSDAQAGFADRVMDRLQTQAKSRMDNLLTPTGAIGAVQSGSSPGGLASMFSGFGADMAQSAVDAATSQVSQQVESFRLVREFSISWRPSYGIARETLFQADTVLSLYDGGNKAVIWQFGLQNRDGNTGANSGFAARTMLGHSWLLGVNVFYDYLHTPRVDRWSAGLDLKSTWLGFSTNFYEGGKTSRPGDGFEYYSPDGWDFEVAGRAPQLPWLSYSANHYFWNAVGEDGIDLEGTTLGLTAHPIPLLDLSLLYDIAQSGDNDFGMEVQLQYDFARPMKEHFDYSSVQTFSDVSRHRFDRVRREYEQRVQRRRLVTSLSIEDQTVTEGDTTASVTITLARALSRDIEISASTSDGTATAGMDYTALVAVPVSIAAGQTSATVTVPLLPDDIVEGNESFTVSLAFTSASIDVEFDRSTATVTINDDDRTNLIVTTGADPTATTPDARIAEPAMGTTVTVTINLNTMRLAEDLTVSLNTVNGSATAGMDFVALTNHQVTLPAGTSRTLGSGLLRQSQPHQVTIPAATASATVEVTILPDEVVELEESFTVVATASAPDGPIEATATVTITDNDMTELSIADHTVTEINEGSADDVLTLTLSIALSVPVDVTVTTGTDSDSNTVDALAGSDYTALAAHTVTIPANSTSFQFPIAIINDEIAEGNEAFTVTIAATADRLTL
ncbi:MAG: Calx-beta domain-containing protein, partial [Candidatus Porifericomitaceae bacterium WSBS_2022_MAG_OTU9]